MRLQLGLILQVAGYFTLERKLVAFYGLTITPNCLRNADDEKECEYVSHHSLPAPAHVLYS